MENKDIFFMFNQEELEYAKNHKYSGTDDSLLVKYFLKFIWNFIVDYLPLWLAPNLITFIGFIIALISFLITFSLSNYMTQPIPNWCCIFNGICTLFYQCLDNLDGKQARRTKSSSPLGQFFDHGCDAIIGVLELSKFCMTFSLGSNLITFYFIILMGIGFLLTSWEEYCLGQFYLGYINGPDEGLFFLGISQIIVGFKPNLKELGNNLIFKYIFLIIFFLTIILIFFN